MTKSIQSVTLAENIKIASYLIGRSYDSDLHWHDAKRSVQEHLQEALRKVEAGEVTDYRVLDKYIQEHGGF